MEDVFYVLSSITTAAQGGIIIEKYLVKEKGAGGMLSFHGVLGDPLPWGDMAPSALLHGHQIRVVLTHCHPTQLHPQTATGMFSTCPKSSSNSEK